MSWFFGDEGEAGEGEGCGELREKTFKGGVEACEPLICV